MLTSGLLVGRLGDDTMEAIAGPIGPHRLPDRSGKVRPGIKAPGQTNTNSDDHLLPEPDLID